jgi:hypothetical protein
MRSHREIIKAAGAEAVHMAVGGRVSIHTVRSWMQRDSIPPEHWLALADAGLTTLDELALAARRASEGAAA